jgi:hypothetical protein
LLMGRLGLRSQISSRLYKRWAPYHRPDGLQRTGVHMRVSHYGCRLAAYAPLKRDIAATYAGNVHLHPFC